MSSVRDRVTHAVLGLADAQERLRLACAAAGLVPDLRVRMGDHGTPEVRRA